MDRPDDQETREIATILAELPTDHPARIALAKHRATVQIMFLLIGKPALLEQVRRVHNRGLERQARLRSAVGSREQESGSMQAL